LQKLMSLYLNDNAPEHCQNQELLSDEVRQGWKIVSITPVGSGVATGTGIDQYPDGYLAGWVVVLLEKA
jgi:hypothetical protein